MKDFLTSEPQPTASCFLSTFCVGVMSTLFVGNSEKGKDEPTIKQCCRQSERRDLEATGSTKCCSESACLGCWEQG